MAAAAGALSALCIDLPRTAGVRQQAPLVDSAAVPAGNGIARNPDPRFRILESQRRAALQSEPGALGLSDDLLRLGSGRSAKQLPAGYDSDSAAATQVDYARHHPCHNAVHALLCAAVPVRSDAFAHHEGVGTVAGPASPTFGYAIFRYRLMDVDLIFKRGMAY